MDQVDAWAADAVRAMYTLGIVGGVTLNDGTVVFQPQSTLTRADAVTMLGRSLERNGELPEVIDASAAAEIPPVEEDDQVATGADAPMEGYEPDLPDNTPAVVDLSQFADAGEIPDYALPYFRALIYLDVIGGSDGRLDPYGTMTRGRHLQGAGHHAVIRYSKRTIPLLPSSPMGGTGEIRRDICRGG